MSSIFDFSKLGELIKTNPPSAIIVVDTNVLMDNPDFLQWNSDLKVDPIFILTHLTIVELAFHSKSKGNQPLGDKAAKAKKANDAFLFLTEQGPLSTGVRLDKVGWFITIPPPEKAKLDPELNNMGIIRDALHDTDTSLMILHREISRAFPGIPALSLTGDKSYTALGRYIGLLVVNSQSFPLTVDGWLKSKLPKSVVDFDKTLASIQKLKNDLIKVRLTLISKRYDADYNFGTDFDSRWGGLIAEGEGLLIYPKLGDIGFIWKLLYRPGTSRVLAIHPLLGEGPMYDGLPSNLDITPIIFLNFLGRQQAIPSSLQSFIEEKLIDMADPIGASENLPSLQSPLCIAEHFMKMMRAIDSIQEDTKYQPIESLNTGQRIIDTWKDPDVFKSYDDFHEYFIERLSTFPKDQVGSFIERIMTVWNVGHSIELVLPPEETSSLDNSSGNQ